MTTTTRTVSDSLFNWDCAGRMEDGTIVWTASNGGQGWTVSPEGGRYAVRYKTYERMRLTADGMLHVGEPEPYWFNTSEWAELCAEHFRRLDAALNARPVAQYLVSNGLLGIGTLGIAPGAAASAFQFRPAHSTKPLISIGPGGEVQTFDLPEMVRIWWRTTRARHVLQRLLWGEKGRP